MYRFRLTNSSTGLRFRYNGLYIPSEFTNVKNSWQQSFPLNRSLKFNSNCSFHVMRKEAVPIDSIEPVLEPPDADHTWNVKVGVLFDFFVASYYN